MCGMYLLVMIGVGLAMTMSFVESVVALAKEIKLKLKID